MSRAWHDKFYRRKFGVVWQFDQLREQSIDDVAATCRAYGIGLVAKTHDGLSWQGDFDGSRLAISGPSALRWLQQQLSVRGVRLGGWVNVRRGDWREQALLHAQVAIRTRWLALDLEPYPQFVGAWPPADGIDEYLSTLIDTVDTRIGERWCLAMWPDPRPERLAELRWPEWSWRATCVYAQTYWTDFELPVNDVLDEAAAAIAHHDVRALLPWDAKPADITDALQHPICQNGAGLWRLGTASPEVLEAFGRGQR